MELTREECEEAYKQLHFENADLKYLSVFAQLIKEHFDKWYKTEQGNIPNITCDRKDGKTFIEISGNYEVKFFMPNEKMVNATIVLREVKE